MTQKATVLFLVIGGIWGIPYFLIAIAVDHFETSSIVFLRVFIGALILMPIAISKKMIRPALRVWPAVLGFAVLEMVLPWYLITEAERSISSSLAGLLITSVPFIAAFFVGLLGDKSAWHPLTILGLVLGFSGVVALVGIDVFAGKLTVAPVLMMLAAATGYAIAPIIANHISSNVPILGIIALSLVIVSLIYLPFAAFSLPRDISGGATWAAWGSVAALGAVCSALAFVLFFSLIREIGPARASLITYVNLAVAVLLGVFFLEERITVGLFVGLPLVVAGSYLASRSRDEYSYRRTPVQES